MSQKVEINLGQFRGVAELVWQHNPYVKQWQSSPQSADDVLRQMIEHARCTEFNEGHQTTTGGYTLQPFFKDGKLSHIFAYYNTLKDERDWHTLESLDGKL